MSSARSPKSATRSPKSATRSPKSATRSHKSATRSHKSATRSHKSATRSYKSATRSPKSATRSPKSATRSPGNATLRVCERSAWRPSCERWASNRTPSCHGRSQPVRSPAAGLLDIENHAPALENRDRARGLRYANRDRVGRYSDGRGGLMAGAQALGKRLLQLTPRGEIAPGGQDDTIPSDHKGAVDRRELLDRFLQSVVQDVALPLGIPVERVEYELVALREHAVAVADHEQRPDRPPLAPLHAQLAGESQGPLEDPGVTSFGKGSAVDAEN